MNAREIRQAELEGEIENATQALQSQLSEYKEKGGNALLILGIIVGAYTLYKLLTDSEEEPEIKKNSFTENRQDSYLTKALIGLATSVAVGFAQKQILSFVDNIINERKN